MINIINNLNKNKNNNRNNNRNNNNNNNNNNNKLIILYKKHKFEGSPHCAHLKFYPKEYMSKVVDFIERNHKSES